MVISKKDEVAFLRLGLSEIDVYNDLYILEMLKLALSNPLLDEREKLSYIDTITLLYQEVFNARYDKHLAR